MADVTLTASGKVVTGFSYPYVAKYDAAAGKITYTSAMELARGVSVDISPETSDNNTFYANNQASEEAPKRFNGGTLSLTVDGLLIAAERFIMGLPESGTDGWSDYNDSTTPPYVGVGYITRYMCGGVETWVPTIICKAKFDLVSSSASTQEDGIDWQTQSLTAAIFRADDAGHTWKSIGKDYATEAEALAALKTKLGVAAG